MTRPFNFALVSALCMATTAMTAQPMTAYANDGASAVKSTAPAPTAAEQVAGLQKMCADEASEIQKRQAAKSLYERLGGTDRISTLATGIVEAHSVNPAIKHHWTHVDKPVVIKHVAEFLVTGTGGKGTYTGRDMASVHAPLKITHDDFLAAGGDVQNVMKGMGYGENEIQEMVCALTSFVPVVVVSQ